MFPSFLFDRVRPGACILLYFISVAFPGLAQTSLNGQSVGVAWTRRGGLNDADWEALITLFSEDSPHVVALGQWSRGTLSEAEDQGLQVVIHCTKAKGKHLKPESKGFGKQDGFTGEAKGAHLRMKFTPAQSEITMKVLEVGGETLCEFTRIQRTKMPRAAVFEGGEYKKVVKSDIAEELRSNASACLADALARTDHLWLWQHRKDLGQSLPEAGRAERFAFWQRFEATLSHSWKNGLLPRHTLDQLMRAEAQALLDAWSIETAGAKNCGWCGTYCVQDVCESGGLVSLLAGLRKNPGIPGLKWYSKVVPGIEKRVLGQELVAYLDRRSEVDRAAWMSCIGGGLDKRGRPNRLPAAQVYLVIGGNTAHRDLRQIDPDLLAAASSLTYYLEENHRLRKVWKLPAKGALMARIHPRGEDSPNKYGVKVLRRGSLDKVEFEKALTAIIMEQLRSD